MLKFEGNDWQERYKPEMGVMLWHPPLGSPHIQWHMELVFVTAQVDLAAGCHRPLRCLYVDVYGHLLGPMDWHDLEGMLFEPDAEAWMWGPEIRVWSSGPGDVRWKGPSTMACMVRFMQRDGWKFQVELSAWFTREASMLWQIRQMCKQLVPAGGGEEEEEELPEEWTQSRDLYWIGDVSFAQVTCAIPANSPHPHDLTKRLAKAALNLSEFRSVRINGEWKDTPPTPQMGVTEHGRLMLITTPYF